jgi:hypothetical protein
MIDALARLGSGWRRIEGFWLGPADARVYALLRIAFSMVALMNVVDLWPHRLAFFSGTGMTGNPEDRECLSAFLFAGSPHLVSTVLVVAALAAVWLAVGVMARPAIVILFVWHTCYSCQGYPLAHGWDVLLRILALILLVSPLGPSLQEWPGRWNCRSGAGRRSVHLVSRHGLMLTQMQLAVVYWQTVWLKVPDTHWRSGEFFSYFMMSIYSRFPSAAWARWEVVSAALSHATLLAELAIPLLLWNRRTRMLGFAVGIGLHFSILVVSHIWLFSLAVLVPYIAFLDGGDLDRLGSRLRREGSKAV